MSNQNDKLESLRKLKRSAGSHSPSREEMVAVFGEDPVHVDACFLSNPYATEIIKEKFSETLQNTELSTLIEAYPPGQKLLLEWMAKVEDINPNNSLVGNGAVQCIEWLMNETHEANLLLPIPTFSTYYEAVNKNKQMHYMQLRAEHDFCIDLTERSQQIIEHNIDMLVLINPNNPTGQFLAPDKIETILKQHDNITILIDESFIHFSESYKSWIKWRKRAVQNPRLIFLKSLSKDYGIAGFRLGYMESSHPVMDELKRKYGTWNVNNFAAMCLRMMAKPTFRINYENAREKFIKDANDFKKQLLNVRDVKLYPTDANFVLIEVTGSKDGFQIVAELLVKHGVYVRTMEDKIGLNDKFIRVAIRSAEENEKILTALDDIMD